MIYDCDNCVLEPQCNETEAAYGNEGMRQIPGPGCPLEMVGNLEERIRAIEAFLNL